MYAATTNTDRSSADDNNNDNSDDTTTTTTTTAAMAAVSAETLSILNAAFGPHQELKGVPTLVDVGSNANEVDEPSSSLLQPNLRGQHVLFRAVDELEQLLKESSVELIQESNTITSLTSLVTGEVHTSAAQALERLTVLGSTIPRRVCQFPFRRNDIVWVCRTCQADETCVLCHNCYKQSNHDGHDVAFYHAQAGGCCDCGDPDAWSPDGFCPHHGMSSNKDALPSDTVDAVHCMVQTAAKWLVDCICSMSHEAQDRANGTASTSTSTSSAAAASVLAPAEMVFHPEAASLSKSRGETLSAQPPSQLPNTAALDLGNLARQGNGLYLVLHADDVHTKPQIAQSLRHLLGASSYFTDSLLNKLVTALQTHGQLVVWGTMELLTDLTAPQRLLWLDGDAVATARLGASMLERATRLAPQSCSIVTRHELFLEQRAVALLEWLTALARSCDPLCQTVAESILPEPHLVPMLRADFSLSSRITKAWHSLLLTLLAVPTFKSHLAAAYCDTYRHVTAQYAKGMGVLERSSYTLSVQFLNRVTYVVDLVQQRDLLGKLGKALHETLLVAIQSQGQLGNKRLNPNHYVLTNRRYSPCVSDLKCVLNVKGMARLFASSAGTFLHDWLSSLSLAQWMDGQVWRTFGQGHVETEPRGWVGAFNASISLGSLFERLLSWDDTDVSPAPDSPLSNHVPTVVELTLHCLFKGLLPWQQTEWTNHVATTHSVSAADVEQAPASLPYATVFTGDALALQALPLTHLSPWSFHLPLHRFVAACLREVCRRHDNANGMETLWQALRQRESTTLLLQGLVEFPILVLSRAAQVRAGLWKRNGSYMFDQVLNYAEPPFCRPLRDADVLLVQFATLGLGSGYIVTLLLHRFGLFDFLGFRKAPNEDVDKYKSQVASGMYPGELQNDDDDAPTLPWTFSPAKDVAALLALQEEFLHLLVVMISELPPIPPATKAEHTMQAKQRLRREVIHRLASGPKTHSELAEVHHVLSNWDNMFLSEEGKEVNPDDATGAALGATLNDVAEHKSVRGKLEPNQWVLKEEVWEDYDPAFYHISLRNHQGAAEKRPTNKSATSKYGVEPKRFAPPMPYPPHASFQRLRRDITSDATVLAVTYRTLHVHCRLKSRDDDFTGLTAPEAYQAAMSETVLARAVHLLTLGAFSWDESAASASTSENWQVHGGSFEGSVFYQSQDGSPTVSGWIDAALLKPPEQVMDCEWYTGQENTLLLLKRLAMDGGSQSVGFVAQDQSVRAGAAWLCDFAAQHNTTAATLLLSKEGSSQVQSKSTDISESDRKRKEAKARAMERMNAQAARFAAMMQIDTEDSEDEKEEVNKKTPLISAQDEAAADGPRRMSSSSFVGSEASFATAVSSATPPPASRFESSSSSSGVKEEGIPPRLLKSRPFCIICNDDSNTNASSRDNDEVPDDDGTRKRSRRKTDRSNALAFVGYSQPSTVLKGGGGTPPTSDNHSALSSVRRFAGVHVALCGHAVHSECCESYLATVHHREDRIIGRREEFKCPLCQRLSNCLVPFIDVGADWIDPPLSQMKDNEEFMEEYMDLDDGSVDAVVTDARVSTTQSLDTFLFMSPWWVGRDDLSVVWDGQSAFVAAPPAPSKEDGDTVSSYDANASKPRRRSVRSLRKKDLYAAWSAMMRTPRFIRRRQQLSRSASGSMMDGDTPNSSSMPSNSTVSQQMQAMDNAATSMGETLVWRRFMDLVSDMAYRADAKRLGEQHFLQYCGEFRHYLVEKHSHNANNRLAGRESADWPACISSVPLPDTRRQELSREKLLSKLLVSIQAFTYSCCSEAFEVKRLLKKEEAEDVSIQSLYSKFGIAGLACDDQLILMPVPSAEEEEGTQPFDGRLGKLRYLGLAVMATAGAVSADLVQLVLSLPLSKEGTEPLPPPPRDGEQILNRAPVVFPILFGHVLTHVVAAMCATSGRARARSDSLELVWPAPFSKRGSFYGMGKEPSVKSVDGVMKDCGGFIKLGLLARIIQVLLGKMQIDPGSAGVGRRVLVLKCLKQALHSGTRLAESNATHVWLFGCAALLDNVLSQDSNMLVVASAAYGTDVLARFKEACQVAADAAISFLADAGTIYQILIPGVKLGLQDKKKSGKSAVDDDEFRMLGTLNALIEDLRLEPIDVMIHSKLVKHVVKDWFRQACDHVVKSETNPNDPSRSMIQKRLFQTEGFRVHDWPMDSCRAKDSDESEGEKKTSAGGEPQDGSSAMELDPVHPARVELSRSSSGPLVSFSSRKSVHLIGGYAEDHRSMPMITSPKPRIYMLPTSYTDLYAELGVLCPDSEQTALCLVCGQVLNANGKGECTKHSFKCGAGSCIFFLLQECQGLIMHSGKAVYVQSPYVDSHGETPQYRGRPLNLDMDRYDIFRELWTGHGIRQKVVQERGSARQVIITDFY